MITTTRFIGALSSVGLGLVLLGASGSAIRADSLTGLADMTAAGGEMLTLTYGGVTYTPGDLILGTTTRWWVDGGGTAILWDPSNPLTDPPQSPAPVAGTSNPKVNDIGAHADNFILGTTSADISSLDGINYQETIFPFPVNTIFIFERGGNDAGSMQGILDDSSLRAEVLFATTANGGPYANTGVSAAGQNAFGVVFTTDVPVRGVRITASGHDALIIAAVPEPSTLALVALGGLALLFAARRRS